MREIWQWISVAGSEFESKSAAMLRTSALILLAVITPATAFACRSLVPYRTAQESAPMAEIILVGEITGEEPVPDINPIPLVRYQVVAESFSKGSPARQLTVYDAPEEPCVKGKPILGPGKWLLHLRSVNGRIHVLYAEARGGQRPRNYFGPVPPHRQR